MPACDRYQENDDGTFTYIEEENGGAEQLMENALELKVTGVIRPKADAANATLRAPVAYNIEAHGLRDRPHERERRRARAGGNARDQCAQRRGI